MFIYNQFIHSYVFVVDENSKGGFDGVFFTSDSNRNKRLYKITANIIIDIFQKIGKDYPSSIEARFDEKKQDYEMKLI